MIEYNQGAAEREVVLWILKSTGQRRMQFNQLLTFPTCGGTFGQPKLLPVVLSVASRRLSSRHLVVWWVGRKSTWLNREVPHRLPSVRTRLLMQRLLLVIHALCHIQLAIERFAWKHTARNTSECLPQLRVKMNVGWQNPSPDNLGYRGMF